MIHFERFAVGLVVIGVFFTIMVVMALLSQAPSYIFYSVIVIVLAYIIGYFSLDSVKY